MSYSPPLSHPVYFAGQLVNTQNWSTGTNGATVTKVEGWRGGHAIRDARNQRSGQDGEYAKRSKKSGRSITLSGDISGSSWADLQTRKDSLAALFTSSSEEILKMPVPSAAAPSWVYAAEMAEFERSTARVVEAIEFVDGEGPFTATWSVGLRASDPRIYSDVATSTDSVTTGSAPRTVTVDQAGTYATPTTLTVTGPTGSSWAIAEPTSGLALSSSGLSALATESVTIDTSARTMNYTSTYLGARSIIAPITAYWALDESSGTVADNAQGTAAYDGTYNGGYTQHQAAFAAGMFGVTLNGTTGYVSVPYNAALHPTSFGLELWAKVTTTSGTARIMDSGTASTGYALDVDSATGVLTVYRGTGATKTAVVTTATGIMPSNTWTHIFLYSYNASGSGTNQVYLWVNGVYAGNATAAVTQASSGGYRFGSTMAGGSFFTGTLASFSLIDLVYKTASALGTQLYAARSAGSTTNAYSYLAASTSRWAPLGTDASTFTLSGSSLTSGSKLNVTYRAARL